MQKIQPKNLSELWTGIKKYIGTRIELLKLTALEKGSKLIADLITNAIVIFCLMMAFLASALTLALYLSHLLASYTYGFGCATIFFTLVAFLISWKKEVFESFIAGIAIRRYFEKHHEAELEEKQQKEKCVAGM